MPSYCSYCGNRLWILGARGRGRLWVGVVGGVPKKGGWAVGRTWVGRAACQGPGDSEGETGAVLPAAGDCGRFTLDARGGVRIALEVIGRSPDDSPDRTKPIFRIKPKCALYDTAGSALRVKPTELI